jgi:hypothetical protein
MPFICSILNNPHSPILKPFEIKFEFGQIIVYVHLSIIFNILGGVLVITVLFSLTNISRTSLEASFSINITSGLTYSIFILIILIKVSSYSISLSRSAKARPSSWT